MYEQYGKNARCVVRTTWLAFAKDNEATYYHTVVEKRIVRVNFDFVLWNGPSNGGGWVKATMMRVGKWRASQREPHLERTNTHCDSCSLHDNRQRTGGKQTMTDGSKSLELLVFIIAVVM